MRKILDSIQSLPKFSGYMLLLFATTATLADDLEETNEVTITVDRI